MALKDELLKAYDRQPHATPGVFGNNFNLAPKPDPLGRRPATPLEIQRARQGELLIDPPLNPNASNYLLRRQARFAKRRGR